MRLLAVALLLAFAGAADAQTFYVASTGDDAAGDGSAMNEWATITHALRNVADGATVLVRPGTYTGRVRMVGQFATGVTVRSEVPYRARLRASDATVVTFFDCQGITMEGFDVAHDGAPASALVVQIQDLIGSPGDPDRTSRITLRDNILHDSFNNDILKINNGAADVVVEGNLFYNQEGSDEHIDVNSVRDVVIQDNIFLNDFAASGRPNAADTSSYIVVKDSNGSSDTELGAENIAILRNVFLHWQGSSGSNFVLLGEDGNDYYEARQVRIENNLMLGDSTEVMRAPFGVKGCQDVSFQYNTVSGDLPSLAFAMRLNTEGANLPNENILIYGNVWSDPTGTMDDFSDTPMGETTSFTLDNNLYFNASSPIPSDPADRVNFSDDLSATTGDPLLLDPTGLSVPTWDDAAGAFRDGSTSIREAFVRLVTQYGTPAPASPAIDAGAPVLPLVDDILGNPRPQGAGFDLGCVERPAATGPALLRNDEIDALPPTTTTIAQAFANLRAGPPYLSPVVAGSYDPDPMVLGGSPLILYELDTPLPVLWLARDGVQLRIEF